MQRRDVRLLLVRDAEGEEELVRPVLRQLTPQGCELAGTLQRVDDSPEGDRVVERVEPELERGDDAEVGACAAEPPEQVRVLVLGGAHDPAVRRDELDREQVVDRQAVLALEPAHAAAEREPGDPGVRHDPDRADEAVLLRRVVEVAEE